MKHTQLTGLVKLGVLALGEVETPIDFLKQNNRSREHSVVMGGMPTLSLSVQ